MPDFHLFSWEVELTIKLASYLASTFFSDVLMSNYEKMDTNYNKIAQRF